MFEMSLRSRFALEASARFSSLLSKALGRCNGILIAAVAFANPFCRLVGFLAVKGNYKKPLIYWSDMPVRLENLKGSLRSGPIDEATGKPAWETGTKAAAYGYLQGTKSADKEGIDIYIGDDETHADKAFVIDQLTPDGSRYDEPKIVTAEPAM